MSNQWEVVGKKKEKGNKTSIPKPVKEIKKKEVPSVKLDEIFAKNQINNLYTNGKSKEKVVEKKKQEPSIKKVPSSKKSETKVQETPKLQPIKSIESALNLINPEEFKNVLEKSKVQFPDAPIVWLKELSQFLNKKILVDVQDPVFTNKPHQYPLGIVPTEIKNVIQKAIVDTNKSNIQLFFDISLTAMATDMVKNAPVLGHKLFLQHIARTHPELVISNLQKHSVLRNSYQNRPNIGLSILWSVGQVGFTNLQGGLKVFEELMLPLIEMKNYSRYIVKYLLNILSVTNSDVTLTKEDHFLILNVIFANHKNFPSELKQDLISAVPNINQLLFSKNKDKLGATVDFYLKKIYNFSNKSYQDTLCDILVSCFTKDPTCLQSITTDYSKNVAPTAILLKYICSNWKRLCDKLDKKALKCALSNIEEMNNQLLLKKRKEEGLLESVSAVKDLLDKMASKRKSGSSFKFLFFILTLVVGGFVCYDIRNEGSWEKSRSRKMLEDAGVCEYTHKVLDYSKQGLMWVDNHIEETFPGYKKTLNDFSEPYIELAKNLCLVGYNIGCNIKNAIVAKYPVVIHSIEGYAPGLLEQSQNMVSNVWTTTTFYFNRSVDYLKKEVFVGQLSPENMHRVVIEALNTTQVKATEYYHWLYEKVQTTIK